MNLEDIRVAVVRIEGTNCEEESFNAFKRLGADPELVHLKQLTGDSSNARKLEDYHVLMFPGGFSAGDYVRAGAIFSARIKSAIGRDLERFVEAGYPAMGICNGFQILVELGLLPGLGGIMTDRPEAVLATNDSDKFECRPSILKHVKKGNRVFTEKMGYGELFTIPSAHAEGKFVLPEERREEMLDQMVKNDQIVFTYVRPDGTPADYPFNPNGSVMDIAGITNPAGNVMGMMPHPERVFFRETAPDWTRNPSIDPADRGDGWYIFSSLIDYVSGKF